MKRKPVKLVLMVMALGCLPLVQGCSDDDDDPFWWLPGVWMPVRGISTSNASFNSGGATGNANNAAGAGGAVSTASGLARTGISANTVSVGGVP